MQKKILDRNFQEKGKGFGETKKSPQYLTALAINLFSFSSGVAYAWTSPAIPKLNGSDDPGNNPLSINITPEEESWLAGLLSLGSAMGPFIFGPLSDKIGRKRTLIYGTIPLILSYIIQAYSNQVYQLYIGRLIGGFGTGAGFTIIPMYIGEISEDSHRGALGCFMPILVTTGFLFSYSVGAFVTIRCFCLINIIPPLIFVAASFFVPESPYYLVAKNRMEQAKTCLRKLRGTNNEQIIQKEMEVIENNVQESFSNKGSPADFFKKKGLKLGISLTTGVMFFQQFSGITAFLSYMQSIFDAAGTSLSPKLSVIIIGCVVTSSCGMAPVFMDKSGRKMLLLISTSGAAIANCSLGIYFYMKTSGCDVESISWLPIASLVLFMVCYNVGLAPCPWVLIGELFPPKFKSLASSISSFVCLIAAFAICILYPYLSIYLGIAQSFWLFSGCCVVGFAFVLVLLPETKGKSLYDIQVMMNR